MVPKLERSVGQALRRRGWSLALAESCTGGLVGHMITNVPGSSDYFLGAIVAYAYDAKVELLGVSRQELIEHGAVSQEVALAMALGARRSLGADVGLAVTGIAGPGGGQPEKPVGLTWLAVAGSASQKVERFEGQGDRLANKQQAAQAALRLLLDFLGEIA